MLELLEFSEASRFHNRLVLAGVSREREREREREEGRKGGREEGRKGGREEGRDKEGLGERGREQDQHSKQSMVTSRI